MGEVWREIEGYEGRYEVSNKGRIRSWIKRNLERRSSPLIMKTKISNCGYEVIVIRYKAENYSEIVHRLVAEAFIPNPEDKPCINHKDGNKTNNNVSNLEWATYSENADHAFKNGLRKGMKGEENAACELTENDILDMRNAYRLGCFWKYEIAEAWGISRGHACNILNNKVWKHV